jgi:uncharacterized DUF497 family protein
MLDFDFVLWDDEDADDAEGFNNVEHIARHGLTQEDVEEVLYSPHSQPATSTSTDRPAVFGWMSDGKRIIVVYELTDEGGVRVIYPITAYEVPPQS